MPFGFPRSFSLVSGFRVSCSLSVMNRVRSVLPGVEWCDKALGLALVVGIFLLTAGAWVIFAMSILSY